MSNSPVTLDRSGVIFAILAYTAWGFLPVYWKLLQAFPAMEILMHRILWSFVFVSAIIFYQRKLFQLLSYLKQKEIWLPVLIASILISMNWFIYIWAVNTNQVVEASLGYYINPLLSILLGLIFLKETMTRLQMGAVLLAALGVGILIWEHGSLPWIALTLALSFALYGLVKKKTKLDSLSGLTLETLMVLPVAVFFLLYLHVEGTSSWQEATIWQNALLMGAGIATATPLIWFASAARRIPLFAIGFFQYLAPTISLVLAIFLYHEPFSIVHLTSFSFIWVASVLYIASITVKRKTKPQVKAHSK